MQLLNILFLSIVFIATCPFIMQRYIRHDCEAARSLFDLIIKMLEYDPADRITLDLALKHSFFTTSGESAGEAAGHTCKQAVFIQTSVSLHILSELTSIRLKFRNILKSCKFLSFVVDFSVGNNRYCLFMLLLISRYCGQVFYV